MEPPEEVGDENATPSERPAEGEVIEQTAERAAERAVQRHIYSAEYHGPLPPPAFLRAYEQLLPGSADRIFQMAEREQTQRHALELRVVEDSADLARRGQVSAVIVAALGLLVALGLGVAGQPIAATVVAAIDLVGLVGVFLIRGYRERPNGDSGDKSESAASDDRRTDS